MAMTWATDANDPITFRSNSVRATERLAGRFTDALRPRLILYLQGKFGAGKTTLARAMFHNCGVTEIVSSPSFPLVATYEANGRFLVHMDFHRSAGKTEWLEAGLEEHLDAADLAVIEWPERASFLPRPDIVITISDGDGQGARTITLAASSAKGRAVLRQMRTTQ